VSNEAIYPPKPARNLGLDLLRCFAVILVIGRHASVDRGNSFLLAVWKNGGWVGVDLFFVLSGYLVSSILFREYQRHGKIRIGRFLVRRGFKIYPAFWVFLLVTVTVQAATGNPPPLVSIFVELLFVQNYLAGIWAHTWSLAVEEHFYILLALSFVVLMQTQPADSFRRVPALFVFVAICCAGLRILNAEWHPEYSTSAYLYRSHLRMDSLFFGVLLAYLVLFRALQMRLHRVPVLVLCLVGASLLSPAFLYELETTPWLTTYGVVMFYLGSGAFVLAAIRFPDSRSPAVLAIGKIGAASYSIYLWHFPIGQLAHELRLDEQGSEVAYWCVYGLGSLLIGCAMNRAIELPALALRDRFYPASR